MANSADLNATYHFYYDGQQCIEIRNGSEQVLKQMVWGTQYVDELIQVGPNQDPQHKDSGTNQENNCERFFWAMTRDMTESAQRSRERSRRDTCWCKAL